jgi:hypothetical protein
MDEELFASARLFATGLVRKWYVFLITFFADPFGLVEQITGNKILLPQRFVPHLLLLSFLVAVFLTYHELRSENVAVQRRLRNATNRMLEIVFGQGNPYEQLDDIVDSHGNRAHLRVYRIGVRNVGGRTISRVHVTLEHLEPARNIRVPLPLCIMHSRAVDGVLPSHTPLDQGQIGYFDVVIKDEWGNIPGHPIIIQHTVSGTANRLPPDVPYIFTLLAHGEGAEPARAQFQVSVDGENRLVCIRRL